MLSKNKKKLITTLQRKKYREQHKLFIAEGHKLVSDLLLASLTAETLIASEEWLANHQEIIQNRNIETIEASSNELKSISLLKSPPPVIGLFKMISIPLDINSLQNKLSLVLDDIQDPGNLGTILRLADWFGIKNIICSPNTADLYNPKVIQASMGAIARVNAHYTPLTPFLESINKMGDLPVYGTFLEGRTIYNEELSTKGLIVLGNEGKGISNEISSYISHKLFIPSYPANEPTSESLNVATATAIVCSEFRRRSF
ncbi:RNA methyltransferase [Marinilabiliaceae bacterium JC017]|nr:RNA methyltransferase [Marinilabiliaceae bacterium JC017]